MKKRLLHLALLGCLLTTALAQTPVRHVPTAAALKKNLARLAASTVGAADIQVERQVVAYLKTHEVSAAAAKSLGLGYLASSDAAQFKVFTYNYESGGSRGTIYQPVFQWKNAAGQLFAYGCGEEWGFKRLYKLRSPPGRMQYLLLGSETGSGLCFYQEARVVELRDDYLLLNKPAFGKQVGFRLCNVPMNFDPARQTLHLDLVEYHHSEYSHSFQNNEALPGQWYRPGAKRLTLKFSNGHFVKIQ